MRRVRWGIVGTGIVANTFARDAALVNSVDVVAVAARNQASAARFAASYGIVKAYQGYEALSADPDIDAIYVGTPHTLHFRNSADALRAGKAVLCEKPITVSAAECAALLGVARETGTYLMEAMWTWFLPALRTAKTWVEQGRIGDLLHVKAELGFAKPFDPHARVYDASLAGGCLLDMGIYPIAIARYFTGRPPRTIDVIAHFAPNGVDDDVLMQFDYGDATASLATSFRCKLSNIAYVVGTDATIVIPNGWSASECHLFVAEQRVDSFKDGRSGSGFEFQIDAVSKDIQAGRTQSLVVPHSASLAFQQDMDRVRSRFGDLNRSVQHPVI